MSEELEFNFDGQSENDGKMVYTVTEISNEIKTMLEDIYPGVWVTGEISNFRLYSSGHMYFNIKDENSQINAVMFQSANVSLDFAPEDGEHVLVYGRISTYPKRGDYQLIVDNMRRQGKGILSEEFEKLKNKLKNEGLFDVSAKLPIPEVVETIGVVTSKDGAALHDILKVLDGMDADVKVLIYPVRVQGKEAEHEIPSAIRYLNENHKELDVLLVGRGGGSIEDLWAFNTEPVVRAIFNSAIPVISCVGHEVDFTISDFAADFRAPTPSAAAETALRSTVEKKRRFRELKEILFDEINFVLDNIKSKLDILSSARAFTRPHLIYEDKIAYIDELGGRLDSSVKKILNFKKDDVVNIMHKLDLVSPLAVLNRGYSICSDSAGNIVKDSKQLDIGGRLSVKLAKGGFTAKIEGKSNDKKTGNF